MNNIYLFQFALSLSCLDNAMRTNNLANSGMSCFLSCLAVKIVVFVDVVIKISS